MAEGGPGCSSRSISDHHDIKEEWRLVGPVPILSSKPCTHVYAKLGKKSDLTIFSTKGTYFAMEAWCGHLGGPLYNGDIEDYDGRAHIICPWHGYMFDIKTGENEIGLQQEVFPVKVENGNVFVQYKCELSLKPYTENK